VHGTAVALDDRFPGCQNTKTPIPNLQQMPKGLSRDIADENTEVLRDLVGVIRHRSRYHSHQLLGPFCYGRAAPGNPATPSG
jgi:hypothetical protein